MTERGLWNVTEELPMIPRDWLAEPFQTHRAHLRKVAYRMLGSAAEADDALQEAWLRVSSSDQGAVGNVGGWLTTVVARVCLDQLRSRRSRREAPESQGPERAVDPQEDLLLADSIGPALLVVLETLAPAERVAFVLHDMFDLPFDEIASIVGRSPDAARQLASRARRRIQGGSETPTPDLRRQRQVVEAFLSASRGGDFDALLAMLDPEVHLRADPTAVETGAANQWGLPSEIVGARAVAEKLQGRARGLRPALLGGNVGAVWVMGGQVRAAWVLTLREARVAGIDLVMDPEHLAEIEVDFVDSA
jgi:RNA polymerase sigma factor (sigma-70 family)